MLEAVRKSRSLRAFGSVMDVYPTGCYVEHMPKGRQATRIGKYWKLTGKYLEAAMDRHEQTNHSK